MKPTRLSYRMRRKILLFVLAFFAVATVPLFFYVRWAFGATATWTNGGGDGLWSTCANWSGGTGTGGCPGTNDIATFNNTSTADSHIDTNISVAGISIASTYSGNIIQDSTRTVTIGASGYSQVGGTFTGGDSAITLNNTSGSFSLTGGIFNNTSATMSIVKNMTVNGGTFNNSGTVRFNSSSINNTQTLTCSSSLPGTFDIAQTTQSGLSFVLSSNCTITLASSISTIGAITNNGTMNATNITLTRSSFTQNGTLNLSGTITFSASHVNGSQTLTCSGSMPGTVNIAQTTQSGLSFILSSDCTVNLATNTSTIGSITNNGTMNGTNITLTRGSFTQNGTLNLSGTLTFSASSDSLSQVLTCTGKLTNSGGLVNIAQGTYHTLTFTLSAGCIIDLVSSITTPGSIINNGTMNATDISLHRNFTQSGTLNLTGTMSFIASNNLYTDQTLTCTGNLTNSGGLVDVAQGTYNTLTFTLSSGCVVNLASTVSTVGSIINNGSMTGTDVSLQSNFTQNGTFTLSGNLTFNGSTNSSTLSCPGGPINAALVLNKTSTGTLTLTGSCTTLGNFTRTNGAISNPASPYTLTVEGNFSTSTTDAFGGANMTLAFGGPKPQTFTQNAGNISTPIVIDKDYYYVSLATALTLDATGNNLTITDGEFRNNSFLATIPGTLTVNDTFTQGTGNVSFGTLTVGASGLYKNVSTGDIVVGAGGVSNSGTVTLGNQNTCGGADSIAITSSSTPTQRDWTGSGTFNMFDLTVTDQAGSASITAYSSTPSNVGANWTFNATCPGGLSPARLGNNARLGGGVRLR